VILLKTIKNKIMKDIAIIIQGPLKTDSITGNHIDCVSKQLETLHEFKENIIFSTWEDQEVSSDIKNNYKFIFNTYPEEKKQLNLWLQKKSTMEGLLMAKNEGFKYALKLRSDMILTNPKEFFKNMDKNKLNFLCWNTFQSYPNSPGYFTDFLVFGEIDEMITLWDIQEDFANGPEIMLTDRYVKHCKLDVNYLLSTLNDNNDINWLKYEFNFSIYPMDKPKPPVCNQPWYVFSETKEFLKEDYIKYLNR